MAEWLIEDGIGERRALIVEDGQVVAGKLYWPGELTAGQICNGQLVAKTPGKHRGTVQIETGTEILVDHLPRGITQGAKVTVEITRAPIAERGRFKMAQGRCVPDNAAADPLRNCPDGKQVRQFPAGLWEEVWEAASSTSVPFPGGSLLLSSTPAMTLIDVDGEGSPRELSLAAIPAIARALRWFDVGGNIGIDFPTIEAKAERRTIDEAFAAALADWPHERTAMNGFGFVQIVARLEGPSLLHRFASSRTGMCARYAMRVAERAEGAGAVLLLTVHPALKAKLKPEWLTELARRKGKQLRIETNPALALEAPQSQIIER